MTKSIHKYIFLDTMIFIHYTKLDQIDFCKVLDASEVTLLISERVVNELDKHKDSHRSAKVKNRSRKFLKNLESELGSDPTTTINIRKNVYLKLFFDEFDVKEDFWSKYNLDRTRNDHAIIASILTYKLKHDDRSVVLISQDSGIKLKAKMSNIETSQLDDKYKLQNEESPEAKKIKVLEEEIRKFKHLRPLLKLTFEGKKSFLEKTFSPAKMINKDDEIDKTYRRLGSEKH